MSATTGSKKAVHVKWAGKTIALGTFPITEADEKCARAKALTRAWRSTMRPKPTRDWVMLELERLNVRVVSGRAIKDEEYVGDDSQGGMAPPNCADPNLVGRRGSITASLLNAADMARSNGGGGEWSGDNGGLGGYDSSSLQRRNGSLSNMMGDLSKQDENSVPPHRPLVGGGSAAAYEAARAEHYRELAEKKNKDQSNVQSNGMDTLVNGMGNGIGGGMSSQGLGGPSINANQHYEMLKLHHMNLLNEIQETTLMMNIYQQQQLQQQQQQQMQQQQIKEQQQKQQQQMQQLQNAQFNNERSRMSQMSSNQHGNSSSGHSSSKDSSHTKQKKSSRSSQPSESNEQPNSIGSSKSADDAGDNGNSHAEKLAKIKAEIEERKRLLEELTGGDDAHDAPSSKRSKTAV